MQPFLLLFLLFLFREVIQRCPDCRHHKGGKCAVGTPDGGFHLLQHIVGEADGFVAGGGNLWNFERHVKHLLYIS